MNKLKFYFTMIACNFACIYAFSQVGINTTSPLSTLDINGNLSVKVINLAGSGTPTTINDLNCNIPNLDYFLSELIDILTYHNKYPWNVKEWENK